MLEVEKLKNSSVCEVSHHPKDGCEEDLLAIPGLHAQRMESGRDEWYHYGHVPYRCQPQRTVYCYTIYMEDMFV